MTELIFASHNPHKTAELRALFEAFGLNVSLRSLADIGYKREIVEDGSTFEENAAIKAKQVWEDTGRLCIADDSGLCVDALGGAPGIYSARYAGEGREDGANNALLLSNMAGIPREERGASFVCVLALAGPDGVRTWRGECRGSILEERSGTGGFGYDCVFWYPPLNSSFGLLPPEVKNRVSHRWDAVRRFAGPQSKK